MGRGYHTAPPARRSKGLHGNPRVCL
jgi:hypothetical protein